MRTVFMRMDPPGGQTRTDVAYYRILEPFAFFPHKSHPFLQDAECRLQRHFDDEVEYHRHDIDAAIACREPFAQFDKRRVEKVTDDFENTLMPGVDIQLA